VVDVMATVLPKRVVLRGAAIRSRRWALDG
jgi:hypothetical protein